MYVITIPAVLTFLIAVACSGCTDKDREMAKRTSDGSDTFKFKAPEKSAPSAEAKEHGTPTLKPDVMPASPKDSDGSDTFHFKPDPKHFPRAQAQGTN